MVRLLVVPRITKDPAHVWAGFLVLEPSLDSVFQLPDLLTVRGTAVNQLVILGVVRDVLPPSPTNVLKILLARWTDLFHHSPPHLFYHSFSYLLIRGGLACR